MRRIAVSLAAVALLGMLVVPAALAAPPAGVPAADPAVMAHWTPARMAQAQWRDRTLATPRAKPGGGGGGGGTVVTGASWTKGGAVVKATGKVYFEMGGGAWICSGTVITDGRSGFSIVLTAGHCAVDETTGEFATNWMFIPSFDTSPTYTCANTTYGCWTAVSLVVPTKFATAGGFTSTATYNDWAFAVVGLGSKGGGQLDATVGSFPLSVTAAAKGVTAYSFGYPAAGKYHGSDLTYCAGPITEDPNNANKTWGVGCDMTGGSSGGPWFTSFSQATGSGVVSSLNSYGYSGVKYMYGPKFNADTSTTFSTADASTSGNKLAP